MVELGSRERTFPNATEMWEVILGFALISLGLYGLYSGYERLVLPISIGAIIAFLFVFIPILLGVTLIWRAIIDCLGSVRLFTGGLEVYYPGRRTTIVWEDITAVIGAIPMRCRGVPIQIGGLLWLDLADGHRVKLPVRLKGLDLLAYRIHEVVLARLLPEAERILHSGGELEFGPVSLDATGICIGDRSLAWAEVSGFSFPWRESGSWDNTPTTIGFHAGSVTPWVIVRIKDVPNAHLFLTLARSLARVAGREPDVVQAASLNLSFPPLAESEPAPATPTPVTSLIPESYYSDSPLPEPRSAPSTPEPPPPLRRSRHVKTWRDQLRGGDMCVLLFVFATIFLGGFVFLMVKAVQSRSFEGALLVALPLIGGGLIVAGVVVGNRSCLEVVVSKRGLAWTRRGQRTERSWDEVRELYINKMQLVKGPNDPGVVGGDFRLVFDDGETMSFDMLLRGYDVLIDAVQRAVILRLLAVAHRRFARGKVTFGPVRLTAEGIELTGNKTAWDAVKKMWIGAGHLGLLTTRGDTAAIALKEVPNYVVLLTLLREQLGERVELP